MTRRLSQDEQQIMALHRSVRIVGKDREKALETSLKAIHEDLKFFLANEGNVSRDDLVSMIRAAQSRIDAVQAVLWPEED